MTVRSGSQASVREVAADGCLTDAESVRDVGLTHPALRHGDDLIPSLGGLRLLARDVLMHEMGSVSIRVEGQVLKPVVGRITVDVVDDFASRQTSSDLLFDNPAMLHPTAAASVFPNESTDVAGRRQMAGEQALTTMPRDGVEARHPTGIGTEPSPLATSRAAPLAFFHPVSIPHERCYPEKVA